VNTTSSNLYGLGLTSEPLVIQPKRLNTLRMIVSNQRDDHAEPTLWVQLSRTKMGLFFSILAVESDKIYERRGRIQRKAGIHPQWHRHADAIRVPEAVFSRFSDAFRTTHPKFNYYGPTEYKGEEIAQLCCQLKAGPWFDKTTDCLIQGEPDALRRILALAEHANTSGLSLLVLGI
jgi:hypothetical protein